MAHLPEPIEDLDDALVSGDPVVRQPKTLVALPDPPSYATRTLVGIGLVALAIGGSLGAVGIGIVYATRMRPVYAATARRGGIATRGPDASSGTYALAAAPDAAGPNFIPELATGPGANLVSSHQRLGRGRTLPAVLRLLGMPKAQTNTVVRALRPILNMRSLQPADVVLVQRDPNDHEAVRRVEYRRSDTQVWAVTIAPDGTCTGERLEVTKSTVRVVSGFLAGDALRANLESAHLQADILPRLQEVFESLNLGHELHRGDAVRLIVEEERLNGVFFRYGRVDAIDYRGASGQRRAFFQHLGAHGGDFFNAQGFSEERGPLRSPVAVPRITSPFNMHRMHPVLHRIMPHLGTDFGADMGTPVYAVADGAVLSVGSGGPTGNLVRLTHPALGIETGYAHLSRFAPGIHSGLHIRVHQLVGYVGSTGRSTGPHLHLSCKRHDEFFNCQTMYQGRHAVAAADRVDFAQAVSRLSAELDAIRLDGAPSGPLPAIAPEGESPDAAAVPPAGEEQVEDNGATE